MKKLTYLLIFLVFITSLSIVSANELNMEELQESPAVYVDSNMDVSGNGSITSPYKTLTEAVNSDASDIYVINGSYSTEKDSQIKITKNQTITGLNEFTITGDYKNYIFHINSNSNLILNNVKFINTHHLNVQTYGAIINYGNLTINNGYFENSDAEQSGVILNYGNLSVDNSIFNYNAANYYGGAITNFGESIINNSNFTSNVAKEGSAILNSYDMVIRNSFFFNNDIKSTEYQSIGSFICIYSSYLRQNSNILINKSGAKIKESYINNIESMDSLIDLSYSFINKYRFNGSELHVNSNLWCGNKNIPKEADDWLVMALTDGGFNSNIPIKTTSNILVSFKLYSGKSYMNIPKNIKLAKEYVTFEAEDGNFNIGGDYIINNQVKAIYTNNTKNTKIHAKLDEYYATLVIGTGFNNQEIFVSNQGSDKNGDGSLKNPYKTISAAVKNSFNGDTIYICSGEYKGAKNSNIEISKSLTFKSYGGEVTIYRSDSCLFNIEKMGEATIIGFNFRVENYDMYFPIVNNTGSASIMNCSFDKINGGDSKKSTKYPIGYIYYSNESVILTSGDLKVEGCNFTNIKYLVIRSQFPIDLDYYKHINIEITNSIFKNCYCMEWHARYDQKDSYIDSIDGICPSFMINVGVDNIIVDNCQFIDNDASVFRVNDLNKFIISNSIFKNNKGSIYDLGNFSEVINCTIVGDTCPKLNFGTGHPFSITRGVKSFKDSIFYKNNYVIIDTWYIYNDDITLYNCSFINNINAPLGNPGYGCEGIIFNNGNMCVDYCTFVNNSAFYGGVFYNNMYDSYYGYSLLNITNSVFYNNSATLGDDIFMSGGTLYTSDCWWGSNAGPNNDNIFVDTADVIINNWAILSFDLENGELIAGFSKVTDADRNVYDITGILPSRIAVFDSDMVEINPKEVLLTNNVAKSRIDFTGIDITANVTVDNQTIDLVFYNKNTRFNLIDRAFYGYGNIYSFDLESINGYELINQDVNFQIWNDAEILVNESLKTHTKGRANYQVNLPMGNYTIKAFYAGDDYFKPTEGVASLEILPFYTVLNIKENQTFWGNKNLLYAHLYDNFAHAVANQTVLFSITDRNNKTFKSYSITDGKGQAGIYLNLPEGSYVVNASYAGDNYHYGCYNQGLLTIKPIGTNLAIEQSSFNGRGNLLTVVLRDDNYRAIYNETIRLAFTKDSVTQYFNITTNEDGRGGVIVNLAPGVYSLEAVFKGDSLNHESKSHSNLIIKKVDTILSGDSLFIFDNTTNTYSVKLMDIYGRFIPDENILIEIVSQSTGVRQLFNAITDDNGVASLKLNLDLANYIARAHFTESLWYGGSEYASTIIVNDYIDGFDPHATVLAADDLIKYYMNESQYIVQLSDIYGNLLSNQRIIIQLDGSTYYRTTNQTGQVKFNVNLKPGTYTANVIFNDSSIYSPSFINSTITVLSRLITNDLTKIYKNDSQFVVKVVGNTGSPELNKRVYITLNNVTHEILTNGSGEAKLNINLKPGIYDIKVEYGDNVVYNKITVISPLTTNNLEMYYKDGSRFKAKVYDNEGHALSNATVNFTVNGVTYSRITNSNGEASLAVNLNTGIYKIITEYGDFTNTNEIFIYNMAVNIDVMESPENTFVVRVTDAYENPISDKHVTFKVNGGSYICEINQTGYAKLNIKLNNGLYRVVTAFCIENYQDRLLYNTLKVTL